MQPLPFRKMHGLGNDFVVIDGRRSAVDLTPEQLRRIGDRHRGVGFDQLVVVEPAEGADARMRFFNSDGSGAGACGNATRCVARLLLEERPDASELRLATEAACSGRAAPAAGLFTVDMAPPRWPGTRCRSRRPATRPWCRSSSTARAADGAQHGQPARRLLRARPGRGRRAAARAAAGARTRCSPSGPISASPRCSTLRASGCACSSAGRG